MITWRSLIRPRSFLRPAKVYLSTGEQLHLPKNWKQLTVEELAVYGLRPNMEPPADGVIRRGPNSRQGGGARPR